MIHFDLKPANFIVVMHGPDGRQADRERKLDTPQAALAGAGARRVRDINFSLKLADFGLAHNLTDSRTHVTADRMGGTLCYMAPESLHQPYTLRNCGGKSFFEKTICWVVIIDVVVVWWHRTWNNRTQHKQ